MSTSPVPPTVVSITSATDLCTHAERQALLRTVAETRKRAREVLREASARVATSKRDCDAAKDALRDAEASYSNVRTAQVECAAYELLNGPCFLFLCSTAALDVPDVWRERARPAGWHHARRLEWADAVAEEMAGAAVGTVRVVAARSPFHTLLGRAYRQAGDKERAFPRTLSFQTDMLRLATRTWADYPDAEALPLRTVRALRALLAAGAARRVPLELVELVVQYFALGQQQPSGMPWPTMLLGHVATHGGTAPLWFADVARLAWDEQVRAGSIAFDEEDPTAASAKRARRAK